MSERMKVSSAMDSLRARDGAAFKAFCEEQDGRRWPASELATALVVVAARHRWNGRRDLDDIANFAATTSERFKANLAVPPLFLEGVIRGALGESGLMWDAPRAYVSAWCIVIAESLLEDWADLSLQEVWLAEAERAVPDGASL